MRLHLVCHATPCVADTESHVLPRCDLHVLPGILIVQGDVRCLNDELAPLRRSVPGVDCQVDQHLLELSWIDSDQSQVGGRHSYQLDVLPDEPPQHLLEVHQDLIEIDNTEFHHLPTGEDQELPGEVRRPSGCFQDLVKIVTDRIILRLGVTQFRKSFSIKVSKSIVL